MGKIHVLSEAVANQIAAGEVVERPASVVKELLENALDAGATRIKIQIEAGGKRLIQITDNGCGMVRDDALLAFERHATSKLKNAEDLLSVSTLGFRGEALPSIASVSRLRLETRAPEDSSGTVIEINGGKILKVEEAGLPGGTSITVRDLFFNTPARKKFLKAESTELSHIASLVTHYALARPEKHFELHSATNAVLVAPPVDGSSERVYQVFGKETLDQLMPLAAVQPLARIGLPQPPPWRREAEGDDVELAEPGEIRVQGFVSRPEIQKLNRSSIYIFVNGRLIRDRLVQHAITEAYRNIIPPTVFPVVLLFLEMPSAEVDVNVHPSKTEVRFRQQTVLHDFVRDTIRATLMRARPVPQFVSEIHAHPTATPSLTPGQTANSGGWRASYQADGKFQLEPQMPPATNERFHFQGGIAIEANAALSLARSNFPGAPQVDPGGLPSGAEAIPADPPFVPGEGCAPAFADEPEALGQLAPSLASLKPLGQIRDSFILAVNDEGLWIVDQHVAHERVLFEKILKQRATQSVESQRLLMPLIVELTPGQQAVFADISEELERNGFEAEPFGTRSLAVKVAPAGVEGVELEHMLYELLEQFSRSEQKLNLEAVRARIAASIACHAAIKVNMALDQDKMVWLLDALARCSFPIACPHGRPVVLRYSVRDIQKAFKRI